MRLSSVVESYIAHKRSLGMLFHSDAVRLHAYVKAMGDLDIRRIRPGAVRKFLDGVGPVTAFWFCKYHTQPVLSVRDRAPLRIEDPTAPDEAP